MIRRRLAPLVALALFVLARPARAQRLEGAVATHVVTYRFSDVGGVGQQTGTYLGATVRLAVGQARIGLRGLIGELVDPQHALPARDVRATGISVGLAVTPWLELGADATARRAVQDPDTMVVRLAGGYGRVDVAFGSGFTGSAELAWYPLSDVVNLPPVSLAVQAGVGVRYAPPRSPLGFFAGYRVLRMDYQSSGGLFPSARLEQDQSLVLELRLHNRR